MLVSTVTGKVEQLCLFNSAFSFSPSCRPHLALEYSGKVCQFQYTLSITSRLGLLWKHILSTKKLEMITICTHFVLV